MWCSGSPVIFFRGRGFIGNSLLRYRVMTTGYMGTTWENFATDVVLLSVGTVLVASIVFLVKHVTAKMLL